MPQVSFPGRRVVLSRFEQIIAAGRLGQSYLFVGPEGAGKEVTALEIARLVNCVDPDGCSGPDICESCRKVLTFQHPDVRWFGPAPATIDEKDVTQILTAKRRNHFHQPAFTAASMITIGDQDHPGPLTMRSLIRFLQRTAFQGRHKVVIVAEGQRMNSATANSFLKTLEEPAPGSLIFLLTSNRSAMLPTIISRCQQIRFEPYGEEELGTLLQDRYGRSGDGIESIVKLADGNARKAVALLEPEAKSLQTWAGRIFNDVHERRLDELQGAASDLHDGAVPAEVVAPECDTPPAVASDLHARRQRAIQLCEMLNLYYSEALACREQGEQWMPRLVEAEAGIRRNSAGRLSRTLLTDLARVEETKAEIAGNLNIGLTMALLFRGLIDNVQQDQR